MSTPCVVSQNDGLAKLTEYLNQTRRQAEASIEVLTNRIKELENGTSKSLDEFNALTAEVCSRHNIFTGCRINFSYDLKERFLFSVVGAVKIGEL